MRTTPVALALLLMLAGCADAPSGWLVGTIDGERGIACVCPLPESPDVGPVRPQRRERVTIDMQHLPMESGWDHITVGRRASAACQKFCTSIRYQERDGCHASAAFQGRGLTIANGFYGYRGGDGCAPAGGNAVVVHP